MALYRNIFLFPFLLMVVWVSAQSEFTSLDEALKNPVRVRSLNIKGRNIGALPETIGKLVNLERLDVSGNRLTTLPQALFQLKKLKYLNLTANLLTGTAPCYWRLKQSGRPGVCL